MTFGKSFSLAGKVAIVTGATTGIGRAIAEGFDVAGASVHGLGKRKIKIQGSSINFHQTDVTIGEVVSELVEKIFHLEKRIDILVNCAGITIPDNENLDWEIGWQETIDVNLTAAVRLCRLVTPLMTKNGYGSIINITSIGSVLGFPENPAYCSSKAGLASFTRAWALDCGVHGIRVNNIVPGYIPTDMTKQSYDDRAKYAARANRTMLRRWGDKSDIANAAIYLASPASGYVTATDIVVDGGWLSKGL